MNQTTNSDPNSSSQPAESHSAELSEAVMQAKIEEFLGR